MNRPSCSAILRSSLSSLVKVSTIYLPEVRTGTRPGLPGVSSKHDLEFLELCRNATQEQPHVPQLIQDLEQPGFHTSDLPSRDAGHKRHILSRDRAVRQRGPLHQSLLALNRVNRKVPNPIQDLRLQRAVKPGAREDLDHGRRHVSQPRPRWSQIGSRTQAPSTPG